MNEDMKQNEIDSMQERCIVLKLVQFKFGMQVTCPISCRKRWHAKAQPSILL